MRGSAFASTNSGVTSSKCVRNSVNSVSGVCVEPTMSAQYRFRFSEPTPCDGSCSGCSSASARSPTSSAVGVMPSRSSPFCRPSRMVLPSFIICSSESPKETFQPIREIAFALSDASISGTGMLCTARPPSNRNPPKQIR